MRSGCMPKSAHRNYESSDHQKLSFVEQMGLLSMFRKKKNQLKQKWSQNKDDRPISWNLTLF